MLEQEVLSAHTTFATGGPARYFCKATTVEAVKASVVFAEEKQLPVLVIGGGSNLLVADAGFDGVVIQPLFTEIAYEESDDAVQVRVGAGVVLDDLVAYTVKQGWWGIENLSAIPGMVGATPVQNVGAYGVEMSDVIMEVTALDRETKEVVTLTHKACQFGYRDSLFKHRSGRYIIMEVVLTLQKVPTPQLSYKDLQSLTDVVTVSQQDIRDHVIDVRSKKFPDWKKEGTAGSFFTNPFISQEAAARLKETYPELPTYLHVDGNVKVSLGWILDKVLGYKGYREGKVRCYEGQALVVVADHGATTDEIMVFIESIAAAVLEATGIAITPEVTFVE